MMLRSRRPSTAALWSRSRDAPLSLRAPAALNSQRLPEAALFKGWADSRGTVKDLSHEGFFSFYMDTPLSVFPAVRPAGVLTEARGPRC